MLLFGVGVFFFKQKTAYEMRISDWSSDMCSSDLGWWAGAASVAMAARAGVPRALRGQGPLPECDAAGADPRHHPSAAGPARYRGSGAAAYAQARAGMSAAQTRHVPAPQWHDHADAAAWAETAATQIAQPLQRDLQTQPQALLLLSGGSTPEPRSEEHTSELQ